MAAPSSYYSVQIARSQARVVLETSATQSRQPPRQVVVTSLTVAEPCAIISEVLLKAVRSECSGKKKTDEKTFTL